MARTESYMLALGTEAPAFSLPDVVSGNELSLEQLKGNKATLVMFICNHCPYVVHVREELVKLGNDYRDKGVGIVAISSNDALQYPADSPDKMKELAIQEEFPFPYLYDESQDVALAYRAACTPDLYLFDASLKLVYRGQLDASRPGNDIPVTGESLRGALDDTLSGKSVSGKQLPSLGCNIKWRE